MIINNIDKLLANKNKTRYWLAKESKVAYANMVKLANNETRSINFDLMENLCLALECTFNDLFEIEDNKKQTE